MQVLKLFFRRTTASDELLKRRPEKNVDLLITLSFATWLAVQDGRNRKAAMYREEDV
ncbi:MAG: hypothetical protein NTV68_16175 [Methanomicrobiales archaeon]|nr:hypothetical protein [Methanomicrobiales archaeon]